MSSSIVTNRDLTFTSNFWNELLKLQGTELKFSSTYHPQMDGQVEVVNKCGKQIQRCFSRDKLREWVNWLLIVVFQNNFSFAIAQDHSSNEVFKEQMLNP